METSENEIRILAPFVTEGRFERMKAVAAARTRHITVLLDNIYQPQNASAVLRTCDCFGVQDIHIIESYNSYRINPMVVLGSDQWLTLVRHANSSDALQQLRSKGYRIVATSLQPGCRELPEFDVTAGPFAIVFGNEKMGVAPEILAAADEHLQIPMWGFTQSLNLSVSAGIIIHTLVNKIRQSIVEYSLSNNEQNELLALWLKKTIKRPNLILDYFS